MKIQFIGTGSGKTSLNRFHSSLLVSSDNYNMLIDCGDGISRALLYNRIGFNSINGILITHFHPDHYSGLAALLIQMKLTGRKTKMDIYIHKSNKEYLQRYIYNSYIFIERLGFELKLVPFEEEIKINESLELSAKQNSHLAVYKEFDIHNRLSFSCISILLSDLDKTILYTGDIGKAEDLFLFEKDKIDILISEISHVEIDKIINAYKLLTIEKLYLTHISDEDETKLEELYSSIPVYEREKIFVAYDGLIIE